MFFNPKLVLSLLVTVPSVFAELNGRCSNHDGICINTGICDSYNGSNVIGKCPNDPNDVKCCFSIPCSSNGKLGNCMFKSQCAGETVTGLCPGGTDFICCLGNVKDIYLTYGSGFSDESERELVKNCQQKLIELNYNCGSSGADGLYGTNTQQCVKQFQQKNGISANGIINNNTYNLLFSNNAIGNSGSSNNSGNSENSGSSNNSGNYIMTAEQFIEKVKSVESTTRDKNTYVQGSFGFPMNQHNKDYFLNEYQNSWNANHQNCIKKASDDTFGFDCVNLIKAVLWGWTGDINDNFGGASYNGNMDVNADGMINLCDASTDFSNIEPGEVVWMEGHIGVYIGNGEVIESSPKWSTDPDGCGKIHISKLENKGYTGEKSRTWTKHGKLPYIQY